MGFWDPGAVVPPLPPVWVGLGKSFHHFEIFPLTSTPLPLELSELWSMITNCLICGTGEQ